MYIWRMSELVLNASSLIQRLSHLFSGTYRSSNEEYAAMRQDFLDLEYRGIHEDKKNLSSDISKIGADLKRSLRNYGKK